jgi:hypothetical protein
MERTAPIIVVGPSGCGKGKYIQELANRENRVLLRCFCRKDRTLRESRAKLHEWAFRRESSLVWLEGTDDLTPEAQSFLRRILETYSASIKFCLECREIERLQEPIRSRCEIVKISHNILPIPSDFIDTNKNYTYRQQEYYEYIKQHPILSVQYSTSINKIRDAPLNNVNVMDNIILGINPLIKINTIFNIPRNEDIEENIRIFVTRCLLMRTNPWCLLAYILTYNEPKDIEEYNGR